MFIKKNYNPNLLSLLTSHFFLRISSGLVSVFVGIILLTSGIPLVYVLLLLGFRFVFRALSYILSDYLVKNTSIRNMLILGTVSYILYFLILANPETSFIWIACFLIVGGLDNVLYWMPFHLIFATAKTHHRGLWVAIRKLIILVASTMNPLLGALLLNNFGNNAFFTFSIIFILLSIVPLFMIDMSYFKIKKVHAVRKINWRPCVIQFFAGIPNGIVTFSWPLIVYLLTDNIVHFGVVLFIIGVIESFFAIGTGYIFDKKMNLKPVIIIVGMLTSISFITMSILPIVFGVIGVIISRSLFEMFHSIFDPLRTLFWYQECNHGTDHNKIYHSIKHSMISWLTGKSLGIFSLAIPVFLGYRLEYALLFALPSIVVLTILFHTLNKKYTSQNIRIMKKKHHHLHHALHA